MDETQSYAILGIHDNPATYTSVQQPDGSFQQVMASPATKVARVRMFVGDQAIDEDLVLPHIITIEEQLDTTVDARIAELQKGVTPTASSLVVNDGQQVVNDEFTIPTGLIAAPDPAINPGVAA